MGKNNRRKYNTAWAPYNFVPMPDKPTYAELDQDGIPQRHDVYADERHTGYFDVRLKTVTPLYIRDMLTPLEKVDGKETRFKDSFFSPNGAKPVIPGSSLRGMLRTLVEIVTSSKMHFVNDSKLVYRAVFGRDSLAQDYRDMVAEEIGNTHFMYPSSKLRGGYLMRGESESGWVIRPATSIHNESFVLVDTDAIRQVGISIHNPQQTYDVFVQPQPRKTYRSQSRRNLELELAQTSIIKLKPQSGLQQAKLVISGKAPKRHWFAAIYSPAANSREDLPISNSMWDDFKLDRDIHRGIETRKIEKEGDPLFYLVDQREKLIFLGPTMFFRMPYRKSIGDLIPQAMRQSNPQIDYAEAMFGYVSERDEKRSPVAYAGRVSATSAHVTQNLDNYFDETIVPRILGSPKPTTFQHYLEQPDGVDTPTHQLRHYGDDTKIRGHKLYWRQNIDSLNSVKEPDTSKTPEKSTQHTRITPVRQGVEFRFKVHFENLSDVELGALIWVLTLGNDPNTHHQMGMGKPLGLGVVKLTPHLVLSHRPDRYRTLFNDDGSWYTAEETLHANQQQPHITAFKTAMGGFDQEARIHELKAMLQLQEPDPNKFSYMTIEPDNDYDGRPVLPHPTEITGRRKG